MKNFIKSLVVFFRRLLSLIKNIKRPDILYVSEVCNGLKVHLGAGPINIQGWINVDARAYDHTHLITKGFDLMEFSDGSISEIYMCHVLEHFTLIEAESILRNLKRKLCVGGTIRISVPSFDKLVEVYIDGNNNLDLIKLAVMGGQDYEFNYHKSIYNNFSLMKMLGECGYVDIEVWETIKDFGIDIGDWSNKYFPSSKGPLMISLNLKGKKGSM